METKPNDAAYPIDAETERATYRDGYGSAGLTKREHFAALAMQGLLAKGAAAYMSASEYAAVADWSVEQADALIAALNKESP